MPAASSKRRATRRTRRNQPVRDGRGADAGRRRPDFPANPTSTRATSRARLASTPTATARSLRRLHARRAGRLLGRQPNLRDLLQPRRLAVRAGRRARLQLRLRHGVQYSTPGDGYAGMRLQPNGDLGQVAYVGQASSPLDRRSLFGRATRDINDNLTAFAQANYSSVEVSTTGAATRLRSRSGRRRFPSTGGRFRRRCRRCSRSRTGIERAARPRRGSCSGCIDFLGGPPPRTWTGTCTRSWQASKAASANATGRGSSYVSSGQTSESALFSNIPSLQRYWNLIAAVPERFHAARFAEQQHLGPRHASRRAATTLRLARAACRSSRTARRSGRAVYRRTASKASRRTPARSRSSIKTSPSSTCRARSPT